VGADENDDEPRRGGTSSKNDLAMQPKRDYYEVLGVSRKDRVAQALLPVLKRPYRGSKHRQECRCHTDQPLSTGYDLEQLEEWLHQRLTERNRSIGTNILDCTSRKTL
jgi:hypothetical protein